MGENWLQELFEQKCKCSEGHLKFGRGPHAAHGPDVRRHWTMILHWRLHRLHWLPIQERVIFKVVVITFKTQSSKQPEYLSEIIRDYEQTRNLRSEGQHLLHVPFLKSASARHAFCYAAPKIWNSLTLDTKNATSLGIFRSKLKTELFTSVYK